MIPVFRKELGELAGLFALALFCTLFVGYAHSTLPLGLRSGFEVVDYLIEDITIISALAAFAAGHSRFGPEYQQKTIHFLDGLPTSRHRVFLVKLVAGALPVCLAVAGIALIKLWALTAHPLPNAAPALPLVLAIALNIGLILFAHYATGLVLSWFGTVGWQALLVSGFCLIVITTLLPGLAPWYPLFEGAMNVQVVGGRPVFPWGPPLFWATWTGLGMFLSWILFLGPGDRIANGPWWIRGIAQVLVYTPPVLFLVLLIFVSTLSTAISLPDLVKSTYRAETEHFRFLATWDNQPAADALIAEAEGIRAQIVDRFGDDGPERLDVELTGASEHLGGVFVPGKLQLRVDADAPTLAHELSHAWSHHLGAPSNDPNAWRFFEEGLATYNENTIAPSSSQAAIPGLGTPGADWFLAPVHSRRARSVNPDEDYAIGQVWAEALVEIGGKHAPSCVIRAAHDRPREGLDGIPWWRLILADCDLELDQLIAAYEARLPRDVRTPELIAWYAGSKSGQHQIAYEGANETDTVVCISRSDHRTGRTQYIIGFAHGGSPCNLSRMGLDPDKFELMVGVVDSQEGGDAWRMGLWHTIVVPH